MEKRSARHRSRRTPRPAESDDQQVRAALDDVRSIIGVDAPSLAKVLPEGIGRATEERPTAMAAALEPSVTRSIRTVATREAQWFGEILAPTIGVAVRKAVSDALARLMQRFNEALERSLSVRSIRWRLEARRTHRPFAEVVLLNTLVYRVEQAFLIHAETGLVLRHVLAEGLPPAQPDQVASMLAAIDAFGREAFAPSPPSAYLHEFSIGDLTVWVDRAAPIAVALVIRGRAPRSLQTALTEVREQILLDHGEALSRFEADTTPFESTVPLLARCLEEQTKQAPQRGPVVLLVLALVTALALGAFGARRHSRNVAEEKQLDTYRQALGAQPGIIVTSSSREDGRYRLAGLRDPVTPEPAELVKGLGRAKPELVFEPFYSLHPRVIEARFRRALTPPETVTVGVHDGALKLSGEATREWIERALAQARTLPGVERVESTLLDTSARDLASATGGLEALDIPFTTGSAELEPQAGDSIARALELLTEIDRLAAALSLKTCITIVGNADESGAAATNRRLARERARAVAGAIPQPSALRMIGLEVRGRGADDVFPPSRSARFRVRTDTGSKEGCAEGDRG
jgi:outer membrane protein OmpA-like peptidoglycan-associated protein